MTPTRDLSNLPGMVHPSLLAKPSQQPPPPPFSTMYSPDSVRVHLLQTLYASTQTTSSGSPQKCIQNEAQIRLWLRSEAYVRFIHFIQQLSHSVQNKKCSDSIPSSAMIEKILAVLSKVSDSIADFPPVQQPQRFGNIAFRSWIAHLEGISETWMEDIANPGQFHPEIRQELSMYFKESFGNGTRIDYGSGHEASFVAWLCCLDLLSLVPLSDHPALVLQVFTTYLQIVRKLQKTYQLEPAGSHGVWGLDDYHFLCYYWGSAQLVDHPMMSPASSIKEDVVNHYCQDYMYLDAVKAIHEVKKGPFFEHSPMLYDISGVKNWRKVNSGLLRMYVVEVLMKFPIVQHFRFGNLLPWERHIAYTADVGENEYKLPAEEDQL